MKNKPAEWPTELERLEAAHAAEQDWRKDKERLLQNAERENARLWEGLNIIAQAGTVHGGAWCVAQAYGYLNDLDFDQFPENGKDR